MLLYLYFICFFFARFYEIVHPHTESIVQEVTTVLREWGIIWKKQFLVCFIIIYVYSLT